MMGNAMIANAQKERLVFWVHGLGGDGSSWQKAAQATTLGNVQGFGPNKIYSAQLSYSEFNNAISTASDFLDQEIIITGDGLSAAKGITDKTKNFIIGHSQGGIVARYMDKRYHDFPQVFGNRNFGGIVTFGTSHQGAIALNNTPMLLQLISEGCTDLLEGPTLEAISNAFPLDLLITGSNVQQVLSPACDFIGNTIVPILASDFVSPINQDYRVGAAVINEINSVQTETKKVAFYGIENDPILWRMLYSLRGKQPNQFPAFGADDDSPLIAKANTNLLKYDLKAKEADNAFAIAYSTRLLSECENWVQWITDPIGCATIPFKNEVTIRKRRAAFDRANAWHRGTDWWLNANDRFKAAVGAGEFIGTNSTIYECDCTSYDGDGNQNNSWQSMSATPQECYNQGSYDPGSGAYTNCYLGTPTTVVTYSLIDVPSDGLVLASSASGYPGAAKKEMIGSNHQQMRNDTNTKNRLNELYNGIHGDYFISR